MRLTRRRALNRLGGIGTALLIPGCSPRPTPPDAKGGGKPVAADGALRLELLHQAAPGSEGFSITRLRAEPRWAGPLRRDTFEPDWGDYRLSVFAGNDLAHRSGFDSSVDAHAPSAARLSVRFPASSTPVKAMIEKRRAANTFSAVWSAEIDPADSNIDRSPVALQTQVHALQINGEPREKVDIAILGDGYQASEQTKFVADAKRAAAYLFAVEPMKTRARDFNVRAVFTPSADSGVTDRYLGVEKNTAFGCVYESGTRERTLAPRDEHALREAASAVDYDFVLLLANARRYGGSAHFGGVATIAVDSAAARYLAVHEFAHVIGGLADEYYLPDASMSAYAGNIEPWHPNVALSAKHAKWPVGAAAPTSWNKAEYELAFSRYVRRYAALRNAHADERAIEELMQAEGLRQASLLSKNSNRRALGLYEGAHGYARGVFRSEVDCVMFSLQSDYFCTACAQAINHMIDAQCR